MQLSVGIQAKFGVTKKEKTTIHARVIFHPFAGSSWMRQSFWILACKVISPT